MVPDLPSDRTGSDAAAGESGRGDSLGRSDESGRDDRPPDVDGALYDLVYRAVREAIWDVLGTATLLLFYLLLAALALSVAVGGLGPFLRGSGSPTALGIGLVAAAVGLLAAVRAYRLATE